MESGARSEWCPGGAFAAGENEVSADGETNSGLLRQQARCADFDGWAAGNFYKKTLPLSRVFIVESGGDLLSRTVTSQVPSALKGLTSVFGMGTGVTPSSLPPEMVSYKVKPRSIPSFRLPALRFR